jgi:hypothetical protein
MNILDFGKLIKSNAYMYNIRGQVWMWVWLSALVSMGLGIVFIFHPHPNN